MDVNYVKVNTRITDQVAVTSVDQEFYNPNAARLEGTFVFPIPKGAHINKFTMDDIHLMDYKSHDTIKAEMAV